MTDPSRPDPAAALLESMRIARAQAERHDPAAAAWIGDVIALTEKALPLIKAHAKWEALLSAAAVMREQQLANAGFVDSLAPMVSATEEVRNG